MTKARTNASASPAVGRNMIINGAMNVAQRSASVTGLGATLSAYHTVDRFPIAVSTSGRLTMTQTADGPNGISANCTKFDCTTADTSIAAGEYFLLRQPFEGQNLQRIGKGVAGAQQITISFYVKSTIAGTFSFIIYAEDGADIIGSTYTINSADTWERKTLTFVGNNLGTIANDTGIGVHLQWNIAAGSNFTGGDNSTWKAYAASLLASGHTQSTHMTVDESTFQLAGCQWEVGEVATPFENIDFADNLQKCQRYYQKSYNYATAPGTGTTVGELGNDGNGSSGNSTGQMIAYDTFYIEMRVTPTMTLYDIAGASGKVSTTKHGTNEYNGETGNLFRAGSKNYSIDRPATGNDANSIRWFFEASAEL